MPFCFAPDNRYFATVIVAFRSVFGQNSSHFTAVCLVCAFKSVLGQNVCVLMPLIFAVTVLDLLLVKEPIFPLHCDMFAVKSVSR